MSHRERSFTALEVKEPDMVPITDLGLDPPIVEAITGKKIGGSSFIAISGKGAWEQNFRAREAMAEACIKLDFDTVPIISHYNLCSKKYRPKFVSKNRFIDEWGRVMGLKSEV